MPIQTFELPSRNYRDGEKTVSFTMPDWVRQIKLELYRCTTATPNVWPNADTTVNIDLERSEDNGTTWIPNGGWGAYGGIFMRPDSSESVSSYATFAYPGGGIIRATLTITNGPLRTHGFITVTD